MCFLYGQLREKWTAPHSQQGELGRLVPDCGAGVDWERFCCPVSFCVCEETAPTESECSEKWDFDSTILES
ncbi:hypothetical protein M514_10653 [Trichuris suis]|uniref:Uncharacterized protein n=1 Tax=Trichuris suis TaxID=68888 RepID=A0A085MXZ6_9BILA|nr:hypothetical protein M514_10653 [Trichuris suis]